MRKDAEAAGLGMRETNRPSGSFRPVLWRTTGEIRLAAIASNKNLHTFF